uniref:(California timema) hypothetical protein n=1 Tax=Timema californicum TaxID=61474 RepID=A0A7R9IYM1_TIMCA|nr:unnamed protein product [Timema californicum]
MEYSWCLFTSVGVYYSPSVDLRGGQGKGSAGQFGNNAPFRATLAPVCTRVKTSVSTCLVLATTVLLSAMSLSGPPVPLLEDKETGELRFDLETGEMNQHPITTDDYCCSFSMHDMETGEFAREQPPAGKKRVFQVPKNVLRPGRSMNRQGKRGLVPILLPTNQEEPVDKCITPLYLLLPVLLVIPAWMPIMSLYIFLECCLHAWSHRKSRKFNTPLRYLMENYCSTCLTERSAQKIIKMQDERKIRAINRKLAYCAYVKKMSVVS